ncbi:Fukutin [Aphelenchoides avenae]|nr:Fukutin [Aphelenchus avenae]
MKTPILIDLECLKGLAAGINCRKDVVIAAAKDDAKALRRTLSDCRWVEYVDDLSKDYVTFHVNGTRRAVLRFDVLPRAVHFDDGTVVTMNIPHNASSFKWHWDRSLFVDCLSLHIPNRKFRLRRVIPLSFVKRAAEFRDKLARYGATAILTGGSLLGRYRECSLIPHTTDFDFIMFAKEGSPALFAEFNRSAAPGYSDFQTYMAFGRWNDSKEFAFCVDGVKIDLFFEYYDAVRKQHYCAGIRSAELQQLRWYVPKIERICVGDLLGRLMYVPCNVEEQLVAYYGANWTLDADSSRYQWDKDTINTEESIFYLESERRDVKYINGRSRGC